MHQVPATIWNQIAEQEPLRTSWAQQMFPLPPEDLQVGLDKEEARLREKQDPEVAGAYLATMPLLWENQALSSFVARNPNLRHVLMPIETVDEAVILASRDWRLNAAQRKRLTTLLRRQPT